jgi:DNA (cytosine-5)-methyltransferase 1
MNAIMGNPSSRVRSGYRGIKEKLEKWPTPRAQDGPHGPARGSLGDKARWPTPRAQDSYERSNWKTIVDANEGGKSQMTLTRKLKYENKGGGQLNPDWVEWLMGWPIGWSSLEPMKELMWLSWDIDPADTGSIPRIATNIPDRVSRLKAIGNGQVPLCVAAVGQFI